MANANVSFIGAKNAGSDKRELFLKVFSGEVITQFEEHTIVRDKHQIHTIESGKSSQFPVLGKAPDAEYHAAGEEILGQQIKQSEVTINVDALLISHLFIDKLDEKLAHFETRSKYAKMLGSRLGLTFDNHVMRNLLLAAETGETVTGTGASGLKITDADFASATASAKFKAWEDALYASAANFDNKFVTGKRYCLLKPEDYYFLVKYVSDNGFSAIHSDYGGQGSYSDGKLIKIAGIELIPTPMLPTADYSGEAYHAINCTGLKALVFTEDAVGTVKVLDISLETEYQITRQGHLMVASYAMGHGVLQPECAVAFTTA